MNYAEEDFFCENVAYKEAEMEQYQKQLYQEYLDKEEKELHDFIENKLVEDCWWDDGSDIFKKYASELLKDKKIKTEYIKKMLSDLFNAVKNEFI